MLSSVASLGIWKFGTRKSGRIRLITVQTFGDRALALRVAIVGGGPAAQAPAGPPPIIATLSAKALSPNV